MNFGPHSVSCRCAGCPKSSAGNNDTRARSWTCAIQIACRCPMVWKADTISISYLTRYHRQRVGYMSCHAMKYLILRSVFLTLNGLLIIFGEFQYIDRKRAVMGKRVPVRVDLGCECDLLIKNTPNTR